MKQPLRRSELEKFVKYCMVGVLNTMLTLGIIFVSKSLIGLDPYLSNVIGYAAGLCNSFMWNRRWVFRSTGRMRREAVVFMAGFGLCYLLQLALVYVVTRSAAGDCEYHIWVFTITGYGMATLAGNILYTVANFIYNRLVTFTGNSGV